MVNIRHYQVILTILTQPNNLYRKTFLKHWSNILNYQKLYTNGKLRDLLYKNIEIIYGSTDRGCPSKKLKGGRRNRERNEIPSRNEGLLATDLRSLRRGWCQHATSSSYAHINVSACKCKERLHDIEPIEPTFLLYMCDKYLFLSSRHEGKCESCWRILIALL